MTEDKELMKTGTTTLALVCKDGIVLAADKRATAGYLIAHKKFDKIINITDNIAVTVAGTVSDVQLLAKYIKAELKLKEISLLKVLIQKFSAFMIVFFATKKIV